MPLFVLSCHDRPGALALRNANRAAHLAHIAAQGPRVKLAGPYLDAAGAMIGSLFILEVENQAAAEAFHAADPYTVAGLFQRVEITPWRLTVGGFA